MVVEKRRLYLGRDKVSLAVSVDDARWNNVLSITGTNVLSITGTVFNLLPKWVFRLFGELCIGINLL